MRQLNIAVTVPIFPNPVQTYILNQIRSLVKLGMNVSLIAEKRGEPGHIRDGDSIQSQPSNLIYISHATTRDLASGVITLPLHQAAYRSAIMRIISSRRLLSSNGLSVVKSIYRASSIRFGPYDILHSHSLFTSYNYLFMKLSLSIPLITTYHGRVPDGVKSLDSSKMRKVFDHGDAFLVNTRYASNDLASLGCPENKIHIIRQGINPDDFTYTERSIQSGSKIILLTVGRLSPEKNHITAIHALKELSSHYPQLEYHIVGNGPELDTLITTCRALGISDRVRFHGVKSGRELQQILDMVHIFILPSTVETQGVVLQEAQACGLPVIASNAGGIPEVITDGVTGILFKTGSHVDLANKINTLIQDPTTYLSLATNGVKDVRDNFHSSVIARQLTDFYHEFLSTRRH